MDDGSKKQPMVPEFAIDPKIATLRAPAPNDGYANAQGIGSIVINADDWGRDPDTTDRIFDCVQIQAVSSVSAMVFMQDSERAADVARDRGIDAGLHLNLTTPFSASHWPPRLIEHQQRCTRFLRAHRLAPVFYHPGLAGSFAYVVQAQVEEFKRLYGHAPNRIDGHHHMHLCANIQFGKLLPAGTQVRRNFSFLHGEKSFLNRAYRGRQDRALARCHSVTDLFFALEPINPQSRLKEIFALADRYRIEVETHPIDQQEFEFLTEGGLMDCKGKVEVARGYFSKIGGAGSNAEGKA